jgi:RNA-binding protein
MSFDKPAAPARVRCRVGMPMEPHALPILPFVDTVDGRTDVAHDAAMTPAPSLLKGKHRRFLRGLGVALKPSVLVGKEGISDGLLAEIATAIEAHELIKVRLLDNLEGHRKDVARELAERSRTDLVQVLGRTVLLWKRNEEEPKIELPA